MPEGHSVHRIARQFMVHFVGHRVEASSPQGRFSGGAAEIDGREMTAAKAIGKQLLLEFDHHLWLRVHLGMYGAWDFAGDLSLPAVPLGEGGDFGRVVGEHEDSLHSIGAPRRTRLRMAESEKVGADLDVFPPDPVGQVRVRLLTENAVADLRGAMVCELLDESGVDAVIAKQGPDPLVDRGSEAEERFTSTIAKKSTSIGLLLMDQSVVSGIGNVYRAELLFRARLNPHTPGKLVPKDLVRELWRDWTTLLTIGVKTGQMMTMDGLDSDSYTRALANRADRHWVYHRDGLPCRVCGTHITMEIAAGRKLYWCQRCQA